MDCASTSPDSRTSSTSPRRRSRRSTRSTPSAPTMSLAPPPRPASAPWCWLAPSPFTASTRKDAAGRRTCSCDPETPYAKSKYQAEQLATAVARAGRHAADDFASGHFVRGGRPGNVARLFRAIDRRRFVWIGDGSNQKSLIHRDDAARACIAAAIGPRQGVRTYNVAAPPCSMREIVQTIARASRANFPPGESRREWPSAQPSGQHVDARPHAAGQPARRRSGNGWPTTLIARRASRPNVTSARKCHWLKESAGRPHGVVPPRRSNAKSIRSLLTGDRRGQVPYA